MWLHILCNSADIFRVGMEMESISGSDLCVSGSEAAGWARGFALAGSSFQSFGYQFVRECFTLWKYHSKSKIFNFKIWQTASTLCILCVGVNVANVIPMIFFNTDFMHVLFPAARCFISIRPHTLAPRMCPQSATVQHYWPLSSSS